MKLIKIQCARTFINVDWCNYDELHRTDGPARRGLSCRPDIRQIFSFWYVKGSMV